jgi:tetratricopeptide (TPR) repeat protein
MTPMRNLFSLFLKMRVAVMIVVILTVVFISYLPVLKSGFLAWDDDVHILNNISIRSLDNEHLKGIFTRTVNKVYIPLTSLSFALEYHYFGYDPFVYHLDNLFLHLCVTAFVFTLARQLGLSMVGAGAAALLFGIHPMRVESVAWATERKDVLYAVFYMAALLSYLKYLDKRNAFFLVLTTFLGGLSMLAKPMALSLPLILFLLDWFKGRGINRRAILEKVPLGLLVGGITWMTYSAHARVPGESVIQSALIWPWTFVFYLRQFIFPFLSVPIYRLQKPVTIVNYEYALSLAVLAVLIFSAFRFRKHKWFLFAVFFYVFSIFFLLRFDEVKDVNVVADRFMYLPGTGLCLLAGLGIDRLWQRRKTADGKVWAAAVGLCVVLIGMLAVKTYRQCYIWKDTVSLWQHQLKYFPDEYIALNNLALELSKQKEFQKAKADYRRIIQMQGQGTQGGFSLSAINTISQIDHVKGLYERAVASNPNFVDAPCNLGELYKNIGLIVEAVYWYKEALRVDYNSKDAHFGLGGLYVDAGDARQAVYAYEQALKFHQEDEEVYISAINAYNEALQKSPGDGRYLEARKDVVTKYEAIVNGNPPRAGAYFSLGLIYSEIGDPGRAVSAYRRALDINPRHSGAWYNLGNIYKEQGDFKRAISFYEKTVEYNPKMSDAYLNIGIIHGRQGNEDSALEYYQRAMKADVKNAKAYFNAGYMEERSGNLLKANELYVKSVEFDPENDKGFYNLGNILVKLGRLEEARSSYVKAVEANPENVDALVNLSILSFQVKDFDSAVHYCDEAILLGYEAPRDYLKALDPYRKKP